jgi:hypothetical protein
MFLATTERRLMEEHHLPKVVLMRGKVVFQPIELRPGIATVVIKGYDM